jgi:hypothetical protein
MQKADALISELRESQRQTEHHMDQFGQRMDNFSQRMDQFSQRMDEINRRMDERNAEADKDRKDFNRRMAQISDSVGTLIEDLVYPNAERIFSQIFPNEPVLSISLRPKRRIAGESMEIDLVAAGDHSVMLVEARHRLNTEDARELQEKLPKFRRFFPDYANHNLALVLASIAIEESLRTFLTRQKIYGLAMGDETMELVNHAEF